MITDEMIDKAALAGLNAVRVHMLCKPLASLNEMTDFDTTHWRREYRAALEAVAADIRNAALEEARMRRSKPGMADWFWRDLDPDDSGDSIHEAIHRMGEGVVCAVSSSFRGPSFFAAIVPTLNPDSDDTDEVIATTAAECARLVKERYAAIRALKTKVTP